MSNIYTVEGLIDFQQAYQAANDGDTIILNPGVYLIDNMEITKNISIRGGGPSPYHVELRGGFTIRGQELRLYNMTLLASSSNSNTNIIQNYNGYVQLSKLVLDDSNKPEGNVYPCIFNNGRITISESSIKSRSGNISVYSESQELIEIINSRFTNLYMVNSTARLVDCLVEDYIYSDASQLESYGRLVHLSKGVIDHIKFNLSRSIIQELKFYNTRPRLVLLASVCEIEKVSSTSTRLQVFKSPEANPILPVNLQVDYFDCN